MSHRGDRASPARVADPGDRTRSGGARILVVDRESSTRNLVGRVLRSGGHEVVGAADAREALHLVVGDSRTFDLLVTDVGVAGMSGIELAARIRAARPQIQVVLMSEQASIIEEARRRPDLVRGALLKPFTSLELIEAVAEAMPVRQP